MNLTHLRYFAAVTKRGSFRRAAEDLHISQPALSNSVKKLEGLLGVQLLERSPQGVFPTAFGEALNHFALSALDAVRRGELEIELLKHGSKGHIRVGAPGGIIEQVIPPIIADVTKSEPNYGFSVTFGYLDDLLEQLTDGRIDFLVTTYWPQANLTENLVIEPLVDLSLSIYARAKHPLANEANVTLQQLEQAEWTVPESPGTRSFVRSIFGENHLGILRQPVFSNHVPFIHAMMETKDLLSIIPDYVVRDFVLDGRFVKIDYPSITTEFSAGIIYLQGRTRTPAMTAFLESARHICTELLSGNNN